MIQSKVEPSSALPRRSAGRVQAISTGHGWT